MMKKVIFLILYFVLAKFGQAQKIDSIYFNLYTDSLKKGFYNYINIDGKTFDGKWIPLSSKEVLFSCNADSALKFQNNDLFVDSSYTKETVTIKAILKADPSVWKQVTIYIRKRGFDEPLKSNEEILDQYRSPQKTKKKS